MTNTDEECPLMPGNTRSVVMQLICGSSKVQACLDSLSAYVVVRISHRLWCPTTAAL